jgi:Rab11 family-interacting protein 3/4
MNLSTCSTQGDQAVLNELNLSEDLPSKASHTQIHIGDLESSSECSEDNEERAHVVEVVAPLNSHIARKLSKMGVSTGTDSSEDQELMTKEFEARLQCLEQENQLLVSRQQNLLSENLKLKENLDVVEDELQEDRRSLENERKERDKEQLDWKRLRSETELEMGMLRMKVNSLHSENEQLKNNEIVLKSRSDLFREEINVKDEHLEGLKSKLENVEVMMRRKEEIWKKERALLKAENDEVLRDLQEISKQKESITLDVEQVTSQRHSTASVDVDFTREIFALNKEIDRLKAENSKLMVDLLQQGKILVSTKVQSLGAELETASRDQLMSTLREAEAYNERLRLYIDSLLANVMEKHPELLEVRGR